MGSSNKKNNVNVMDIKCVNYETSGCKSIKKKK